MTGIRHDRWAKKNRIQVEVNKSERERNHYLHPEVFDQPEERGVEWARHPELMRQLKQTREQMRQQTGQRQEQQSGQLATATYV